MLKPNISTVTVTTAGTRVQAASSSTACYILIFESIAGTIYVGDSTVASTKYVAKLTAGQRLVLQGYPDGGPNAGCFQLSSFYLDCATNGDKCQVTYFQRMDNA